MFIQHGSARNPREQATPYHRDPVSTWYPQDPGMVPCAWCRGEPRPRVLIAGLALVIVGLTLLTGTAQALATFGGAVVFVFAAAQGWQGKSWEQDRRRERPMPPGGEGFY